MVGELLPAREQMQLIGLNLNVAPQVAAPVSIFGDATAVNQQNNNLQIIDGSFNGGDGGAGGAGGVGGDNNVNQSNSVTFF